MSMENQVRLFRDMFAGRNDVYGTYDPKSGRAWQVKAAITDGVIEAHLTGQRPLGLYLLEKDTIRAAAVDFDTDETEPPMEFVAHLRGLGLPGYVERSKSKGHHVWIFFCREGVKAVDARRVLNGILAKMGRRNVEVFPKQDHLIDTTHYGNFINLPLFGRLVPRGRTVFVDDDFAPIQDQWKFLATVQRISAASLKKAIAPPVHGASPRRDAPDHIKADAISDMVCSYGLRHCARRMLAEGVSNHQRSACFRLASQLRKAGLPLEYTLLVLGRWAAKNHPDNGRQIITKAEIHSQARYAYRPREYRACGCDDPAVKPFCDPAECPIGRKRQSVRAASSRPSAYDPAFRHA